MFHVAYRTLLVMFYALTCKFYFVDFYQVLWNVYIFSNMASENACIGLLCKIRKNIIFQNKTLSSTSDVLQT